MSVETGTPLSRGSAPRGTISQEKEPVSGRGLYVCPLPSTLPRARESRAPCAPVIGVGEGAKSIRGWTPHNPGLQITQQHSWGLCPGRYLGQGQGHTMVRPSRTTVASRTVAPPGGHRRYCSQHQLCLATHHQEQAQSPVASSHSPLRDPAP